MVDDSRRLGAVASEIRRFDGDEVLADARRVADLRRGLCLEQWPDSTPPRVEVYERRLREMSLGGVTTWLSYDARGDADGMAVVQPVRRELEKASLLIYVPPEHRRNGVGMSLLRVGVGEMRRRGVSVFGAFTISPIAAGEIFARRLNAFPRRTLRLAEAPVKRLTARPPYGGATQSAAIEVFEGQYPSAARMDDIARLAEEVGSAFGRPKAGTIQERRRRFNQQQDLVLRTGLERWTICAVSDTHSCVGYSEYLWDPEEPGVLFHHVLSVAESSRRTEIAFALVVARQRVLDARPSIRWVRHARTCRSGSGSALSPQRIRQEHGIRHHYETRWRIHLDDAETFLSQDGGTS